MKPGISVIVNTLNEEANLSNALRSVVKWADEIVVIDMYSEDKTVEIAKSFGATVHFHERVNFVEPARTFAISRASREWILILDADELIPPLLAKTLKEISKDEATDIVFIPRLNFICGAAIMNTGWGPDQDAQLRFFKKDRIQLNSRIHQFINPSAGTRKRTLKYQPGLAIIHFNYIDCEQLIEKMNRYTSIEARQMLDRGEKATFGRMIYSGAKIFISRYLKNNGYRDGWRGLYLSFLMAFYRFSTFAKFNEIKELGGRESVVKNYQKEAERILSGYESDLR